jgi:ABC-2 type transport system permease protein
MRRSLRTVLVLVRKEFAQLLRDPRMLVVSLLAPVVQVLLLGYAATLDITNAGTVICDLDRTAASRALAEDFVTSGYFVERARVEEAGLVDAWFERGAASAAIVIPKGYGRDILSRRTATVQVLLDGADANTANILLGYATQIANAHALTVLEAGLRAGGGPAAARLVPEPRIWFNPDLRSSHFMVPGVVALVLMIITMTLTALGIVKEKEIGTLEQLMVTPVRPTELILGKLIPFVLIGFVDVVVVLGLARYWFGVPLVGSITLLFGLSGLFILTTLGLGLFISTIARSQQQAMMIAQFFFFMPFMFLSGFAIPISNMPPVIQALTYAIPLRYYLEIVRGIFLKGAGIAELWPQAAALAGIGMTVLSLSILRFRKTLE